MPLSQREWWQKPILRRLQPPPPVNDTNPFNVFRPREKAHRLHTRRMQRRENNVQSFEKLRQVRRNLEQAKTILEALIKREEKKKDVMESDTSIQRIQMKYKHETELLEDSLALHAFPSFPSKFGSSEEEFFVSDDVASSRLHTQPAEVKKSLFQDSKLLTAYAGSIRPEFRRRHAPYEWIQMSQFSCSRNPWIQINWRQLALTPLQSLRRPMALVRANAAFVEGLVVGVG